MNKNEKEVYMANKKKTAQDIVKPIKKTKKKKIDYKRIWKNIKKGCCKACDTISKNCVFLSQ